jgi:hypothetical protein
MKQTVVRKLALMYVVYYLFAHACFSVIVNECEKGSHNCTRNEHCVDEAKGFKCECEREYERDSITGLCHGMSVHVMTVHVRLTSVIQSTLFSSVQFDRV